MAEIVMPRLSDSMEEGAIYRWLRSSGDLVREGEEIVEIETDKAVVAYEAEESGRLQIVVPDGGEARVGELIARIEDGAA